MVAVKKQRAPKTATAIALQRRHEHEGEGVVAGAVTGAAVGAIAGPPGAIAGAIIGGLIGGLTGAVLDTAVGENTANDRKLDAEIGVSGGDLGAPNLLHPPAIRGTFSAASAGAGGGLGSTPSEGPTQAPES